jgi:hypothetical protein
MKKQPMAFLKSLSAAIEHVVPAMGEALASQNQSA